jgi:hypothetical protein
VLAMFLSTAVLSIVFVCVDQFALVITSSYLGVLIMQANC